MGSVNEKNTLNDSIHVNGIILEKPKIKRGLIIPKEITP